MVNSPWELGHELALLLVEIIPQRLVKGEMKRKDGFGQLVV